MKKSIFISLGFLAMSVCNAYAEYTIEYGDATYFGGASAIAKCSEDWLGAFNCATLDYDLTFVTKWDDGTCKYVPSCATCPSGYALENEPNTYYMTEVVFIGDGRNVNGSTDEDIRDNILEYYSCYQLPTSCESGFYGTTTNGTTGCGECPSWAGVYKDSARTLQAYATSIPGSNSKITDCYIANGTYYDVTGTFKMEGTTKCKYSN